MSDPADLDRWYRSPGNVTARDLIRAAEERGWVLVRIRGSHHIFRKDGWGRHLTIPVPVHAVGTIRGIIKDLLAEERRDDPGS